MAKKLALTLVKMMDVTRMVLRAAIITAWARDSLVYLGMVQADTDEILAGMAFGL
jgi:hypothetical protein